MNEPHVTTKHPTDSPFRLGLRNGLEKIPAGGVQPPLDGAVLHQFQAWERGFDAHARGAAFESCPEHARARPPWKNGWLAAQRVEELREELKNVL